MKCNICGAESTFFADGAILHKHRVAYFRCNQCGFIQTEEPYWLGEAYENAINSNDVGLVSRNITLAEITKAVISIFFDQKKSFLDFGGGYGMFVRIMRDRGFDFYRYDKHCENLFARDFDADLQADAHYELLTAFEVFEHLANPLTDIAAMLKLSSNIIFTTELIPSQIPKPDSWWYYGLEHGQHVSFYTVRTLSIIAAKNRLNLYTDGRAIHLFTDKRLSPLLFRVVSRYRIAFFLNQFIRLDSLRHQDYCKSLERTKSVVKH
jgi:hypothetical protein